MYQQTDSDKLQGSIRMPIETNLYFQRDISAPFDRLPLHERQYKAAVGQPFAALESKERKSAKHMEIPRRTPVTEVIHQNIEPVQSGCPHRYPHDHQKLFRLDKSYSPK